MKRLFAVALGILTAIGGFVDIGDIVANTETGARFGMSLAWVVVVGVIGICLFAEMAGRVATVSKRATFDLVRERLGARVALVNLVASFFITFLTLAAEIGGVALETGPSCGYAVAQYFGFQWGKFVRPADASRFHLITVVSIVLGAGLVLTTSWWWPTTPTTWATR